MIALGADHAGFELKNHLLTYLEGKGYKCADLGTYNTDTIDTPDIAAPLAEKVVEGLYEAGILICGSGVGMSIAANKVPGIRAVLATNQYLAKTSRQHNDTNILCLGARVIGTGLAEEIVDTWLNTPFDNQDKRLRRLKKLLELEDRYKIFKNNKGIL